MVGVDQIPGSQQMRLGLESLRAILDQFQLNRFSCPVVTVAGTNGKGSCVRALEAIALDAGLQIGCFTSPHLIRVNERFRLNGASVSDPLLDAALAWVDAIPVSVPLSFFERFYLAAVKIFQDAQPDLVVFEVGLGGRLDATNAIDADLAVITAIDLDHQHILGDTREEIASEKAGILREHGRLICADPSPPRSLSQIADTLSVKADWLADTYGFEMVDHQVVWHIGQQRFQSPKPKLPIWSVAAAMQAATQLARSMGLSSLDQHLLSAVEASLSGRFQRINYAGRDWIFDCAHNPQSAEYLAKNLEDIGPDRRWIAIFGVMQDKDLERMVRVLHDRIMSWYSVSSGEGRGISAQTACERVKRALPDADVQPLESVETALEPALAAHDLHCGVVVFGSFVVVGSVLEWVQANEEHQYA